MVIMDAYGEDVYDNLLLYEFPQDPLLHEHPLRKQNQYQQRSLEGGGGGNKQNNYYLVVDKDGVEYDPYSLAWRYLGVYIDCDIDAIQNAAEGSNDDNRNKDHRRQLPEEKNNKDGGDQCPRKLLWAAYVDRRYEGNNIEEYKFYDIHTGEWDNSTCLASGEQHRCVNLNCHEPHSKYFTLVGVYKETNGLYDWFEQLFKHEGMCIWNDEDVYDTMTSWMENLPTQCKKLEMSDDYDNQLYMSTAPLPEGNMTLGIYVDKSCTQLSDYMDYSIYITRLYQNYYEKSYYYRYYGYSGYYQYYYKQGQQMIQEYKTAVATWNEYMSNFKICQPCRAYNLLWNQQQKKGDNKHERRRNDRLLGNNNNNNKNNNDGDGTEQARYNCYDAAGYTNVNQCYKFESKTSMAIAEPEDLARASEQGSILRIRAYGSVYGQGGYVSKSDLDMQAIYFISLAVVAVCSVAICLGCFARCCYRARHLKMEGKSSSSLSETLYEEDSYFDEKDHVDVTSTTPRAGSVWRNRFSRKKRRAADIETIHNHKDIEFGSYAPPLRQETPSPSRNSDWLKITSVSSNSYEIEMKQCTFNNATEKIRISKSHRLQTQLRTLISEVGTVQGASHKCTAATSADKGDKFSTISPEASSDVAAQPPLPESLASDHDYCIVERADDVRSNHIGDDTEELGPFGNDNVLIPCCSPHDGSSQLSTSVPGDDIMAASSRNEFQAVDHIGTIDASECKGSIGSATLNESSSLSRELTLDDSSTFAGPALLLVILVKQSAAAVIIQAEWRRIITSQSFRGKRNAAIVCQCSMRKWAAQRRAVEMRLQLPAAKMELHSKILNLSATMQCLQSRAAVKIQRTWRDCNVRALRG